jgi:hypothetical protein
MFHSIMLGIRAPRKGLSAIIPKWGSAATPFANAFATRSPKIRPFVPPAPTRPARPPGAEDCFFSGPPEKGSRRGQTIALERQPARTDRLHSSMRALALLPVPPPTRWQSRSSSTPAAVAGFRDQILEPVIAVI